MSYTVQAPSTAVSRRLWAWNKTDASQFTLDKDESGSGASLSVETVATSTDAPWDTVLKITSAADDGWRIWEINDFAIPASGKYVMRGVIGPRATGDVVYGIGNQPQIALAYQDGDHAVLMGRHTTSPLGVLITTNNQDIDSDTFASLQLGTTDFGDNSDAGGIFEVEVSVRHPDTGIDPEVHIVWSRGSRGQRTMSSDITGWVGDDIAGAGWDSSWQSGGDLKVGIGNFETGVAGATYLADLSIYKHPEDY